jgi:DNA transformation protein and related proteins
VDPEHIRDLFAGFGPVSVRRMFGGAGIFADGVMFALIVRDVIYLKVDDVTLPAFEQEGMSPFTYTAKGGTRGVMSYWRMPDRLYDDPDELARWAAAALAAALRKAAGARAPGRGGKVKAAKPKIFRAKTSRAKTSRAKASRAKASRAKASRAKASRAKTSRAGQA